MNFEDVIIPPKNFEYKNWQLGSLLQEELPENGLALLWISDHRGVRGEAEILNFSNLRAQLFQQSNTEMNVPICDLGDLVSGKTLEDSHYIVEEIVSTCLYKKSTPIIIGGGVDFAHPLFSSLNHHFKNVDYVHFSDRISLQHEGEEITARNFLGKIFSSKNFSLKNFHLLGYQRHTAEEDGIKILKQVDFDAVRLADMMGASSKAEPYTRKADLVTVNCDAVESFGEPFSVHPQVNGLNRREVCSCMKEVGLSESLKVVGLFNYNFQTGSILNDQLLVQMIWYLIEGINIRRSHPKEKNFETYFVMIEDEEYTFKREIFADLWYFGSFDEIDKCLPCSKEDYEEAKRGHLNARLQKLGS